MLREARGHRHSSRDPFAERGERHWTIAAIAAAALAVIGTGISTYAAVQASEAQASAARAAKRQREAEAQIAQEAAAYEERQHRRKIRLLLGKQLAIGAASGIVPDFGSPLLAEIANVKQGEIEALNIRHQGQTAADSKLFEAGMAGFEARQAKSQIPLQIASGVVSAAGSGLSAYSSVSSRAPQQKPTVTHNWYNGGYYKRVG